MAKLNNVYNESMEKGVKALVENSKYDKATKHLTFDAKGIEMPEGVTNETLKAHTDFINNLAGQVETATAQVARNQRGEDESLTTLDGTLDLGCLQINSQHHLQQKVGDESLYGHGTTAVDYVHSDEHASWLNTQRTSSQELAAKLFG